MATSASSDFGGMIHAAVDAAIREAIDIEFDNYVDELVKRLDEKRDEVLAKSVLSISSMMSYQDLGQEIRVTVNKELL